MRVALISDIHSNLPALEQVMRLISEEDIDETWCLGDIAEGNAPVDIACLDLVRERCSVILQGNHDYEYRESNLWIHERQPAERVGDIALYHASPVNPYWHYVHDHQAAQEALALDGNAKLIIVGHIHTPSAYTAERVLAKPAWHTQELEITERTILCPGSVGQPFTAQNVVQWAILDVEEGKPIKVTFRADPIDHAPWTESGMIALTELLKQG